MRIVFMGTPQFAVPCLDILIKSKHQIIAVVSQPDKPQGRKMLTVPTPVKMLAESHNITVLQPESLKSLEFKSLIEKLNPDLFVTCAYGKMLPNEILNIPKNGCINVHASLLPKYRGAAPIQWSIIRGEKFTGITTMLTEIGMDTGPILYSEKIQIDLNVTYGELQDQLMKLAPNVLINTLDLLSRGEITPVAQDGISATYAPMLSREDGIIKWVKSAEDLHNLIRGINPWPCAYTWFEGKRLKILSSQVNDIFENDLKRVPGEIINISNIGITIACGSGSIIISEVQPESGKVMSAKSFANGSHVSIGDAFSISNDYSEDS